MLQRLAHSYASAVCVIILPVLAHALPPPLALGAAQPGPTEEAHSIAETLAYLARGGHVDALDADGRTGLLKAAEKGHLNLVKLLLSRGANVDAKDRNGFTPLIAALAHRNGEIARLLISRGADVNNDATGLSPLQLAVGAGMDDVVPALVARGAKTLLGGRDGVTILHWAAYYGCAKGIESLVRTGRLDVNARTARGQTALHIAGTRAHTAVVRVLLSHGARADERDNRQRTPLHCAIVAGELDAAKLLAERSGPSDVFAAAGLGQIDRLRELLGANSSSANARDPSQVRPLHCAVRNGDFPTTRLLVAKGADVNAADSSGRTALHDAAAHGRRDLVEFLLSRGARPLVKDNAGKTYLDLLVHHDASEIEKEFGVRVAYQYQRENFFPEAWLREPVSATAVPLPLARLAEVLPHVGRFLAAYPKDLLRRDLDTIYIISVLKLNGRFYGGTYGRRCIYVTAPWGSRSANEMVGKLHHEFCGILLRSHPFPAQKWRAANGPDWKYAGGTLGYLDDIARAEAQTPDLLLGGFLVAYACCSLEEDLSCFADWHFTKRTELLRLASRYERIGRKYEILLSFYRTLGVVSAGGSQGRPETRPHSSSPSP